MITLHFHLQPQYKYELFHIYFTRFQCTGRYELNKLTLFPRCGFIAQFVEHRTGIAEVMGSNPVEALIFFFSFFFFFRLLLSNCLNWKIEGVEKKGTVDVYSEYLQQPYRSLSLSRNNNNNKKIK